MPQSDFNAHATAVWDASADRYVEFVGTDISGATEGPVDRALLAAFVELVASRPGGLVADVGCGPGRVAAFLARSGLSVVGIDPSAELLARACLAHPAITFDQGRLDDLPIADASLTGAVCWYSIINTPPAELDRCLVELHRAIEPGGHLLVAFQSGGGEAVVRSDAHGTGLPLTSYRHGVADVIRRMEAAGFELRATTERVPEFAHETSAQAFVVARRRQPTADARRAVDRHRAN